MRTLPAGIGRMHPIPGWAAGGMLALSLAGAVFGLLAGLLGDPASAWFAVFEGAVLGGILGVVAGFALGVLVWLGGLAAKRRRRVASAFTLESSSELPRGVAEPWRVYAGDRALSRRAATCGRAAVCALRLPQTSEREGV